jgi:uncharacterized membrane protein
MDDSFLIALALLGLATLVLGPVGFFLTLGARARLATAERRIIDLQKALTQLRPPPQPQPSVAPLRAPELPAAPTANGVQPVARPTTATIEPVPPTPRPKPAESTIAASSTDKTRSLEEKLGTRWAVWIGGVALALGALLLVRYSIEQGWFGPAARIVFGLLFAAALIGAGEYMRRRDPLRNVAIATNRKVAPIPAVLTAAGTVAAFGDIYAAHALYGFIGPAAAFVLLGTVGLVAVLAAALHGPALAGLGLLGALITPLLIHSNEPSLWPVVLYLAIVTAFTYALARLRSWLWLALSAAIGSFLWGIAFLLGGDLLSNEAAVLHGILQTFLATALFAVINGVGVADEAARSDRYALLVPSAFAVLALIALNVEPLLGVFGTGWMIAAGLSMTILAIGGLLAPTAAGLVLAAGVMLALTLLIWPPNGNLPIFPSEAWFTIWPHPKAASAFAGFAAIGAAGLALTALRRLIGGLALRMPIALLYTGAATLIPLAVLTITYMRLAHSEINLPFAAIAGGLAFAFLIAANFFFSRAASNTHATLQLGLGAFAAASLAALSLGLVFALDHGVLTVALALAALGTAFVDRRLGIIALRWCVAALGLIIAARLLYEPRIVGDALGTTPIFNWLLWGYGVPAAAFGVASQLLRRRAEDTPFLIAQALCILFSALLCFFEIRHAINGGDAFAQTSDLIEQGLFATTSFAFAIVLTRLDVARTSPVLRYASLAFGVVSVATSLFGLLIFQNPLWSGELVEGGLIVNALLLAYGLPALLALQLSRTARSVRPLWYWQGARIAALILLFAFANLQLRRFFQTEDLSWKLLRSSAQSATASEIYSYSALWLTLSITCLAYGLWRGSAISRLASAILMLMTIFKVFFYDLAGLTGVLRALSFIGLGLVLIGIGLVYQKLVFSQRPPAA